MSLTISVGRPVLDDDLVVWLDQRTDLNACLVGAGVAPVADRTMPPGAVSRACIDTFSATCLQTLRHVAMHRIANPLYMAQPLGPFVSTFSDEVFDNGYTAADHLCYHSDTEGFYVPREFDTVISSERVYGQDVGSSFHLWSELVAIASALDITLGVDGTLSAVEADRVNAVAASQTSLCREHVAWIALYEAARLSLEHDAVIVFE